MLGAGSLIVAFFSYIIMRDNEKISKLQQEKKESEIENIELKIEKDVNSTPLDKLVDEHNEELRKRTS